MNDVDIYRQLEDVKESSHKDNEEKKSRLLELLEAVAVNPQDNEGALRVVELVEELGWSSVRVRGQLRRLVESGDVEVVDLRIKSLDNKMRPSSGYRLVANDG